MEFLDRKEEKARLNKALSREKPSLIVVYGRRRIGKSELLKRVLTDRDVYFMADKTDQAQQRHLFAKAMATKFPNFDNISFPTWENLLSELSFRAQHEQMFTVCLDEFPYMVKSCPELPSVLQKFIDMKRLPFHLILCGSSQHTMQDIVLNSSEPLFGRAQQIIKLKPLHVHFLSEAFEESADKLVDEYAVWGGVPRYWELREEDGNMTDTIMSEIANTEGMLYDEPDRLLADDLQQTAMASSILSIIGSGANRLSEIASRLNRKSTDISVSVKKLMDLGYIEREIPFGENPKNTKRSFYKISDEFLNFYHRFIVPERSLIGLGRKKVVEQYIEANFADFAGKEWERLCRRAVSGNELYGVTWNVASRWWGTIARDKQIELDVVAESIDKKSLLIGECKWTKTENASELLENLKKRSKYFAYVKNHKVYYTLFLRHEPVDRMQENIILPQEVINDFGLYE